MNSLEWHKSKAKQEYKKTDKTLTLMQYQHQYAVRLGFKSWAELKKAVENK